MQKSRRPVAVDLFCGAGGLSLGFEQAGFRVAVAIDANPINTSVYSNNFPSTKTICADISELSGTEIRAIAKLGNERIDVVFGGPPCQGFSAIGKRKPDDPRNALISEFCRLVSELKPRYFVIENVAGLLYANSRSILEGALESLRSHGYTWVSPVQVLDAQTFGVPQRRKRVFVLGYESDQPAPAYPKPLNRTVTVWQAISDLRVLGGKKRLYGVDDFHGKLGSPTPYSAVLRKNPKRTVLSGCLLCSHRPEVIDRFRGTPPGKTEKISRFARLNKTAVAPTLRAGTPPSNGSFTAARPIHPTQPRCITVREAARLHSFPDWFEFHGTQWHGFQQVGNAVPPRLARAVARTLLKHMR